MTPQIIYLILLSISAYLNFKNNFEMKPIESEWINRNRWVIWVSNRLVLLGLLYWGGFFNIFLK